MIMIDFFRVIKLWFMNCSWQIIEFSGFLSSCDTVAFIIE